MATLPKPVSRRSFLPVAAAALAAPYFFSRTALADPKRAVVYNFDGELGKFYSDYWIKPFMEENDVRIETIAMVGSAPPMDKLAAQIAAGRPEADVVPLQPPQLIFAERNNLLLKIEPYALTEAVNYQDGYVTPFGPKLGLWSYGLAYNTQKIPSPPTAWRDMWDPKFKGMVGLNDALWEQTLQMVNLAFGRTSTPIDDSTFANLTQIRPNLVSLWTTGAQAEQLFRNGEIAISPLWNGRVFNLINQGVPLDFVIPKEGFLARWNAYAIPRNARSPELAIRFIDYVMNEKRQLALAEKLSYGSPNKKVIYPSADVKRRVVVASPENLAKVVPEDFAVIADNTADWSRRWTRWKST